MTTLGVVGLILASLYWWLRSLGLPFEEEVAKAVRSALNPVLSFLSDFDFLQPAAVLIASVLYDTTRQAAMGYWFVAASVSLPLVIWLGRSGKPYKNLYGLESLVRIHALKTPRVQPVMNCDPRKDTSVDGPWARALTQWEWMDRLDGIDMNSMKTPMDIDNPPRVVQDALIDQIRLVNPAGSERAGVCAKGVMLVCLERIVNGRKAGNLMIDQLASCFSECTLEDYVKLRVGGELPCQKVIDEHWSKISPSSPMGEVIVEAVEKHAYASTQTVWMVNRARQETGVLEPAALLWLRPCCRPLWLAVHQIGLEVANVEACAVASHYKHEEEEGRAMEEPCLSSAIFGLNDILGLYPKDL